MLARVFVLAVVYFVNAESAVLRVKGLFCRDPDTGKLHPVNATWSSTTFCGNYICKLRKSNETVVQEPIREFKVTDLNFKVQNDAKEISTGNVENGKKTQELRIAVPELRFKIPIEEILKEDHTNLDDDRYLTENEIQSIANVLHNVKKSDVDALIEVYTLAQEIYHEIDKVTDQKDVNESVNNLKARILSLDARDINNHYGKSKDIEATITNSYPIYLINTLRKEAIDNSKYPTYFNGPLTIKGFSKIPFYYPLSAFQRMSSYVHQPDQLVKKPVATPHDTEIAPEIIQSTTAYAEKKDQQKLIKPTSLLPYPFSYVNKYNLSKYTNMYSSNHWVWDYFYFSRTEKTPLLKAYFPHMPQYTGSVSVNPHLHDQEEVQNIEQPIKKPQNSANIKNDEPWKTKPLSSQVINEIKANINPHRIKVFPFRKKVKIEKVIKMDEMTRARRDTNEIDHSEKNGPCYAKQRMEKPVPINVVEGEYEAVIEKITCDPQIMPGYFRYGNQTEPYPRCCPQLIRSR